ncbi:MAG: ATP-binding cassette domain-containing protein [Eubacterium sp.]|nr:ATP-binding cassette domain-containing protein [Eubacterium sp.]
MAEKVIIMKDVCKDFKVLNRHEGLKGSLKDLFSRDYKIVSAVSHVSLSIEKGEIVGYLGPNGAGKSTTIKMMTGVLEPTSGQILVDGTIPYQNRTKNAEKIGVVFGQRSQLWWALPLIESLKLLKDIYMIPDQDYKNMLELYRSLVDIEDLLHKPVRQMSLGQRTLSDILAAFLHNPKIVYLDEPTIGLDVSMKSKIRTLIHALNQEKGTTVILTTHDMGDVDALCRRIVIIDHGKMLYDNDIEHLKKFFGSYRTLKLRLSGDMKKEMEQITQELPMCSVGMTEDEAWITILVDEEKRKVMDVLGQIQNSYKVRDLQLEEISTEDVIRKIYEDSAAEREKEKNAPGNEKSAKDQEGGGAE